MKKILLILSFIISCSQDVKKESQQKLLPYSKITKPKISKSDCYLFFNDVLEKNAFIITELLQKTKLDKTHIKILNHFTKKSKNKKLSRLINKNDLYFFIEQSKKRKSYSLDFSKINRIKSSRKKLNELSTQNLEVYWRKIYAIGDGYYFLSLPLFSIDKSIAIMEYNYSCGNVCYHLETRIYKRLSGKWTHITSIGRMIIS